MFCEKCGTQIKKDSLFCEKCGNEVLREDSHNIVKSTSNSKNLESKSWFRLLKVVYTFFYFFLTVILYFVFTESSQTYNYYSSSYTYDYGNGIWIAFLTLLFGSAFLKLLKVSFFYIASGVKPNWVIEAKKVFNPFY